MFRKFIIFFLLFSGVHLLSSDFELKTNAENNTLDQISRNATSTGQDIINCITFVNCYLVTGGQNGFIHFYDPNTLQLKFKLENSGNIPGPITAIVPYEKTFIFADSYGRVRICQNIGENDFTLPFKISQLPLLTLKKFQNKNLKDYFLTASRKMIGVISFNEGDDDILFKFDLEEEEIEIASLEMINDTLIVAGLNNGTILFLEIDWEEKKFILSKELNAHKDKVSALCNVNGKYLLSGSNDKTVKIWNLKTLNCDQPYKFDSEVNIITFDKENNKALIGLNSQFLINLDLTTMKYESVPNNTIYISAIYNSADYLAVASSGSRLTVYPKKKQLARTRLKQKGQTKVNSMDLQKDGNSDKNSDNMEQ